jgi:hypothetical protein
MLFAMPTYQVKYHGKKEWEGVSEIMVLGKLQEAFGQVTPVIQKMIAGQQVLTPNAVFRIKGFDELPFE